MGGVSLPFPFHWHWGPCCVHMPVTSSTHQSLKIQPMTVFPWLSCYLIEVFSLWRPLSLLVVTWICSVSRILCGFWLYI